MTFDLFKPRMGAVFLLVGAVLLALPARRVSADDGVGSHSAITRDTELPPLMEARAKKPRYAGWLLTAYLAPPAIAAAGVAADSSALLISSAVLLWLAPTAVHLFAGEYGLAAREALLFVFAGGGVIVGGLIGLGAAALAGQGQAAAEEDPGINRVIGLLVGGLLGGVVGVLTWAIIDISGTFERDASRRRAYARSHGDQQLTLDVQPRLGGVLVRVGGVF